MNMDEMQKECEARALKLITQGKMLREIDMRLIAREVIQEEIYGKKKGKNANIVSMQRQEP